MVCLVQSPKEVKGRTRKQFESPSVSAPRGPSLGCWAGIHLPPAYPRLNPESASSCVVNDIRLPRAFFTQLIESAELAAELSGDSLGLREQEW